MKITALHKGHYTNNKDLLSDRFGQLHPPAVPLARLGAVEYLHAIDYRSSVPELLRSGTFGRRTGPPR
jgi:hypothetical protein